MFFLYFITLLVVYLLDFIYIFTYLYIIYIYLYITKNNFLFFTKYNILNIRVSNSIKGITKNFKFFFLKTQTFIKNFKPNLSWKPLFKKISYFGFYRNIINNNINKK